MNYDENVNNRWEVLRGDVNRLGEGNTVKLTDYAAVLLSSDRVIVVAVFYVENNYKFF